MDYDVIVIGLGTAGGETLRELAGTGLRVLGLERLNGMGGTGTLGCISFGASIPARMIDLERACKAVTIVYEATVIAARSIGRCVTEVSYVANGVRFDVSGRIVIDASGEATVGRLLGLPLRRGCSFDGTVASGARAESWQKSSGEIRPIYRNFPMPCSEHSPEGLANQALMWHVRRHQGWLSREKGSRLLRPSLMMGVRESARYWTERLQDLEGALRDVPVEDPIIHAWEPEDLPVYDSAYAFESKATQNWKVLCGLPLFGFPVSLSYRTIVVRGFDNLLCPSRHLGVSHDLGGAMRMQSQMRQSGLAAACAAEIALERNLPVGAVPYTELRSRLLSKGGLTVARKSDVTSCGGYVFEPYSDDQVIGALRQDVVRTPEWWYAKSENRPCEQAAWAYWNVWKRKLRGDAKEVAALADRLQSEMNRCDRYSLNFAVALGLLDDARCVPMLRNVVTACNSVLDPVVERAFPNRLKAILLLGRFADVASVAPLFEIVEDDARAFADRLLQAKAFGSLDMCRYQALSYVLMALRNILIRHPDKGVLQALRAWRERPILLRDAEGYDLARRIKRIAFDAG